MVKVIVTTWNKIPAPMQRWIKGAEVAVLTGVVTAIVTAPAADFSSKTSITKFAAYIAVAAGGCMRLYMAQSPLQNVIKQVSAEKTVSAGGVSVKQTLSETTSGPNSAI